VDLHDSSYDEKTPVYENFKLQLRDKIIHKIMEKSKSIPHIKIYVGDQKTAGNLFSNS